MAISTEQKYLLNNKMGKVANLVQLGTLIQSAETGGLAAGAVGTTELAALAVTSAKLGGDAVSDASKIADLAVSTEHLDAGITYTHRVYGAGKFTTLGGDATETITVAGAVAGDIILVNVQTAGGTPRSVVGAVPGTGNVVVTMSGDPSTDHVLAWVAYRAVS